MATKSYVKDYPRPQMVRSQWENLNGPWEFAFDKNNEGEKLGWYQKFEPTHTICVPFTYETKLSGIGIEEHCQAVWYSREIDVPETDKSVLIHFEGSDYVTDLWVNGIHVGDHTGGYSRFSFDITDYLTSGKNRLTVKVWDSMDKSQPRGKQRWMKDNYACWYVQTTGIWKTVWLEYVPKTRIESIKLTPCLSDISVKIDATLNRFPASGAVLTAKAYFDGTLVANTSVMVKEPRVSLSLDVCSLAADPSGIQRWSPENPALYDLELCLESEDGRDEILSYFGMREITIEGNKILLNGCLLYQRLMLDQGYWKDSHLTPPSEEALIEDIDKIMELGYNGVRKHMKIEDERFLYWADVKGFLVWSEAAAAYQFNDTAISNFTKEWIDIVRQNYNHPSIITWTPFNESWGIPGVFTEKAQQDFTKSIYYLTKSMDPMRPVICNDGWVHTISDIITLHDYEEKGETFLERYSDEYAILGNQIPHNGFTYAFAKGYEYQGQPVIISEFGGIAFNNDDSGWGYGNKVQTQEDFLVRFDSITTAVKELPYCSGYCYTQVTDVQQEINGLMDIDRNFKLPPERIREVNLK